MEQYILWWQADKNKNTLQHKKIRCNGNDNNYCYFSPGKPVNIYDLCLLLQIIVSLLQPTSPWTLNTAQLLVRRAPN